MYRLIVSRKYVTLLVLYDNSIYISISKSQQNDEE